MCGDCRFFSHPYCVRKSSGILKGNRIKYNLPEYVADTYSCKHNVTRENLRIRKEKKNERFELQGICYQV